MDPPSPIHNRVAGAGREFMRTRGYEPDYGRRVPRSLSAAGLTDVGTHAVAVQIQADFEQGVPQWELLAEQLAPGLLAGGWVDAAYLEASTALCRDTDTVFFAPLMISSWAQRPFSIGESATGG